MRGIIEAIVGHTEPVIINGATYARAGLIAGKLAVISAFDHSSMRGVPSVGIGKCYEDDGMIIFRGRIDFCLPGADVAYDRIVRAGDRGRWSFGAYVFDWLREDRPVPVARIYRIWEVSLASHAADQATQTRSITDAPGVPSCRVEEANA